MTVEVSQRKKLLWIKADQLHPLNSGGRIRTYNMLKHLKSEFETTYFCLGNRSNKALSRMHEYSDNAFVVEIPQRKPAAMWEMFDLVQSLLFTRLPYVIQKYTAHAISNALEKLLSENTFDVVVCDFLSLSANLVALQRQQEAKYVVFQHNVESRIWQRHAETSTNPLKRALYLGQWRRFLRYETATCNWFDGVIAVSQSDAYDFENELGVDNLLGFVETGVDTSFFTPRPSLVESKNIVFLGSMDWSPNIEGICEFVDQCYPLIRQRYPVVTLTIVGRNPASRVLKLAEDNPSITVTGTVDDVRPFLQEAALTVVPLRVGGGTRIKIYEAMAAGVPVVSTHVGAEGLPLDHGDSIMLANDWPAFAESVLKVLKDTSLAASLSKRGGEVVRENYSWEVVTAEFANMLRLA